MPLHFDLNERRFKFKQQGSKDEAFIGRHALYSNVRGNGQNAMRHFLYVLILSQYCCHSLDNKSKVDTQGVRKSDMVISDSILSGHPIKFYIDHKSIPQICKDLFMGVRQPSDDIGVLSLLDSAFTSNSLTRPFYFLTITRTMGNADGAYAEPLGRMGKRFVETRTKEFVVYFQKEVLLTNKDFEEWAKTVAGEIKIVAEGQAQKELNNFTNRLELNCQTCDEVQMIILNDFIKRVRNHCP